MDDLINAGLLQVSEPAVVEFDEIAPAHQELWENKHRASNCVLNHALPQLGLKSRDELYQAWSMKASGAQAQAGQSKRAESEPRPKNKGTRPLPAPAEGA
jgi:hypothetical protein